MVKNFDAEGVSKMTSRMIEASLRAAEGSKDSVSIPEQAGGSNELGFELMTILVHRLGVWVPERHKPRWALRLLEIARSWDALDVAEEALEAMLSDEAEVRWKTYTSPFGDGFERDYQYYLGLAKAGNLGHSDWMKQYGHLIDRGGDDAV